MKKSLHQTGYPVSRSTLSAFIALVIAIMMIQGLPVVHPAQREIRKSLVPLAYMMGLKQGEWSLFSPQVNRNNSQIEVVSPNGKTLWATPDWAETNTFQKYRRYRSNPYATILPFLSRTQAPSALSGSFRDPASPPGNRPAVIWNWLPSADPSLEPGQHLSHCRDWDCIPYSQRTLLFR